MADFPYLPIWTDAYLADTTHLRTEEHGRLLLLLMKAWGRPRRPMPTKAELATVLMTPDRCRRIVRYELHPSNWPDGKWEDVRLAVITRDGEVCTYCGSTDGPFDVDHIIPKSRGGGNVSSNLTVACVSCNRSKGARTPEEWRGRAE